MSKNAFLGGVILLSLTANGCRRFGHHPPPIHVFHSRPAAFAPKISPDGRLLSSLFTRDRKTYVLIRGVGDLRVRSRIPLGLRYLKLHFWAPDSKSLLFVQRTGRKGLWNLYELNLSTRKLRCWTPGKHTWVDHLMPYSVGMVVGLRRGRRSLSDAYRLDLRTRTLTLLMKNPGNVFSYLGDRRGRLRALTLLEKGGRMKLVVRRDRRSPWRTVRTWAPDTAGYAVRFVCDDNQLLLMDATGENTKVLARYDIRGGTVKVVYRDPRADLPGPI